MYIPIYPTVAKSRPVPAARAPVVFLDVSQVLNLGTHQQWCNSTVCTAVKRDFSFSSLGIQSLGSAEFSDSNLGDFPSGGSYLCPLRTAGLVPAPTGGFPSSKRFLCTPGAAGQIRAPTLGFPSSKSYPHTPKTVGHVPAPLLDLLVVEAICTLLGQWDVS